MSLIEQLGGYAAAKAKCDRANKEGYLLLSVPVQNGFGDIYVYKVEAALLEYRRQHNIYEAGDLVVSKNGCELVSEITYLQGGLAKIKNEKFDHVYSLQDFRHATDEEIKAGKRLEVV